MRRFWNPYRSLTIISNYGGNVNKVSIFLPMDNIKNQKYSKYIDNICI